MGKIILFIFLITCVFGNLFAQKNRTSKKKVVVAKSTLSPLPILPKKDTVDLNSPLVWHTDVFKANDLAVKQNKSIFAFFTGSDWCGWCMRLQANVFRKNEFIQWANKNVILLELDYPRGKELPAPLTQQNAELRQAFQIGGYPTIWMFNLNKDSASNKVSIIPYGTLGYPNSPTPGKEQVVFLETANAILAKKSK